MTILRLGKKSISFRIYAMYEWYMGNVRMVQGKCTNSTWAMYQIEMAFLHHLTTLPTIVTTLSTAHSIISVYHKNAILLLLASYFLTY